MRPLTVIALAVCVGLLAGQFYATAAPPSKEPTPPPRFQLVGFTSATFTGNQGVLGFTLACQAEFPESRMCTSEEILETTFVPILPAAAGAQVGGRGL